MTNQFRQVGVPDSNTTIATVRQYLRTAQARIESLLNRPRFPRPPTLLKSLQLLRGILQAAYDVLPLRRLEHLCGRLQLLHNQVDDGAFLGYHQEDSSYKTLRNIYSDVTGLLVELSDTPKTKNDLEQDSLLRRFLDTAQKRGWKVAEPKPEDEDQSDGFIQSIRYLNQISIPSNELLSTNTDFGITTGAIVLAPDQSIPETTLRRWAKQQDVYLVFGQYIVLPQVQLLGVSPNLVTTEDDIISLNRFVSISNLLNKDQNEQLIRFPKRVQHHYYCPIVNVSAYDRQHFRSWDVLTK